MLNRTFQPAQIRVELVAPHIKSILFPNILPLTSFRSFFLIRFQDFKPRAAFDRTRFLNIQHFFHLHHADRFRLSCQSRYGGRRPACPDSAY